MPNTIIANPNGGAAVIVEAVQGPPGTATLSVTGTGFVHVTSSTLDGTARAVGLASADVTGVLSVANGGTALSAVGPNGSVLGVAAGAFAFLTTLAAALLPVLSLSGDVTGSSTIGTATVPTVVTAIRGVSVPTPPGAGTTVLTDTTGVLSWSAPATTSVTGTGLWYSAGGSLNAAAVTLSGDLTPGALSGGNLPLTVTQARAGLVMWAVTTGIQTWATAATASLAQSSTAATTGANMTLAPQPSSNANASPGNLIVALGLETGTGQYAELQVTRGGVASFAVGGNASATVLWLGPPAAAQTNTNMALMYFGNDLYVNNASGVFISNNPNTPIASFNSQGSIQFFDGIFFDWGGGTPVGILGLANATTLPTSLPTAHSTLYSNGGALEVATFASALQFSALSVAPALTQAATSVNVQGQDLSIFPQYSTKSGGSQGGGSLIIPLQVPSGSGTEAYVVVGHGYSARVQLGILATVPTFGALYLGPVTPGASNYILASDGSTQLAINGPVFVNLAGSGTAFAVGSQNGIQLGAVTASTQSFGGGIAVVGITNATTQPSSNPSGGVVVWASGGTFSSGQPGLMVRGSLGAITTLSANGSALTVNGQFQGKDCAWGTCQTVSSATATTILSYTVPTGFGGRCRLILISRATTAPGSGYSLGDVVTAEYSATFADYTAAGGVIFGSSGAPTLVSAAQTTGTGLTAVLTATVSGHVITFKCTNDALATHANELYAEFYFC